MSSHLSMSHGNMPHPPPGRTWKAGAAYGLSPPLPSSGGKAGFGMAWLSLGLGPAHAAAKPLELVRPW